MGRRLRDDRGAVMAEAVIVIPFLLIVWFGLVALEQLYAARLRVQIEAGAKSMAMAASGDCGDADVSLGDLAQTEGAEGGFESETGSMVEDIAGCQPFAWAHSNVTAQALVTGLPQRIVAGGEASVRGARSLMCNMKPVDGLMDLVTGFVSDALGLGGD
jgi:hypothetical protein